MTPEGKVKKATKEFLKKAGIWHFMPVQNGMGVIGIPDILACVPVTITPDMVGKTMGVFMGIETKAPGKIKNTTANQRNILKCIHECYGVSVVVDNSNSVIESLNKLRLNGDVDFHLPK